MDPLNIALQYSIGEEILIHTAVCFAMASKSLQPVLPVAVDVEITLHLASRRKLWLRDFDIFFLQVDTFRYILSDSRSHVRC